METSGLFFAFVGAALLFFADWQNWSVEWVASIMFMASAAVGYCIQRWRIQFSMFLTLALVGAEWASERMKPFPTDVSASVPNLFVLAGLGFIWAITASLVGAGVRSFYDAGSK